MKPDDMCECGMVFDDHSKVDLSEQLQEPAIIYICPGNTSGMAPSIFKLKQKEAQNETNI